LSSIILQRKGISKEYNEGIGKSRTKGNFMHSPFAGEKHSSTEAAAKAGAVF
jgi:hypothetical protein